MDKKPCKHCGAKLGKKTLIRHQLECYLNPARNVDYRCSHCNKSFSRQCNLHRHIELKHNPNKTRIPTTACDPIGKLAKTELYSVSTHKIDSDKLMVSQEFLKIRLTPLGLEKAAAGQLEEILAHSINTELMKHRGKKLLGQLSIETASLDYPISSGMEYLDELDVGELMKQVEKTDQSEKLITLDAENPFVNVSLFVRRPIQYGAGRLL